MNARYCVAGIPYSLEHNLDADVGIRKRNGWCKSRVW